MLITRTPDELNLACLKRKGPVFFVPTMGALHEGHLSLIRAAAKERASIKPRGTVVVSIFVNPTQFNDPRDLATYPRDEATDSILAQQSGCDVLFMPSVETMYPCGLQSAKIVPGEIAKRWEGEHRPGHFEGVATVVAKLFHLVLPDTAYFGEKDWQQCQVVAQMVQDLHFPVSLRFLPTVREPDGLAMSSRNALLTPKARAIAPALFRALLSTAAHFQAGKPRLEAEAEAAQFILSAGFDSVDYLAVVEAETLEPAKPGAAGPFRVIGAARLAGIRLIDNVPV